MDAITLKSVTKSFKKSSIRKEHTTLKTELVNLFRRKKRPSAGTGTIDVLKGVDLSIPQGKTVGIIGRNGSGKSTLLKLITGIYTPTTGTIDVNGRISALLELGAGFHPDFSGRENIFINGIIVGMTRAEIRKRMDTIIEFSELGDFIDEPVRTYSSGMFMRLAFSVATHVDPEILIVDEILAVGDDHFRRKSMAKMNEFKQSGKTIVLVTHDLGNVSGWCDAAAWIDEGLIRLQGDPGHVVEQYRQAVALSEAQAESTTNVARLQVPTASSAATPTVGPQAGLEHRWGDYQLEMETIRLVGPSGEETKQLDVESPLEIQIPFVTRGPLEDVTFLVRIVRADGLQVYGTSTSTDGWRLPSPLPQRGTVRLKFERLGFTPGHYTVDVAAQSAAGATHDYQRGLYAFEVTSPLGDFGIARPPHRWSLDSVDVEVSPKVSGQRP